MNITASLIVAFYIMLFKVSHLKKRINILWNHYSNNTSKLVL